MENGGEMEMEAEVNATSTLQEDNELTRVTEWRFAPGATTGYHRHEYDYVVVPLTDGRLALSGPDGETVADLVTGRSYFRHAGIEHDVKNVNEHEFAFVEVEFKGTGAG